MRSIVQLGSRCSRSFVQVESITAVENGVRRVGTRCRRKVTVKRIDSMREKERERKKKRGREGREGERATCALKNDRKTRILQNKSPNQ